MTWSDGKCRCRWANPGNPRYIRYHDEEWGVPVHDDRRLFEILEGFQAGLSGECVLNKQEAFRRAFDDFDWDKVAAYDEARQAALYADPGIIRNRRKIQIEPVKSQVTADRPSHLAGLLRIACFANIPGARIFRQKEGLMICQPGYRAALFINGHDHRYFGGALEICDQGGKLVLVLNVLLKNCDAAHRILFQILPHGLRQRLFFRIQ